MSESDARDQRPEVLWSHRVGFQPVGVSSGYFNGDSKPDVVVGYGQPVVVALDSGGDVLWRFPTRHAVWRVATGDIDGDGRDDVLTHNLSARKPVAIDVSGDGGRTWRTLAARAMTRGSTTSSFQWVVDVMPTGRARGTSAGIGGQRSGGRVRAISRGRGHGQQGVTLRLVSPGSNR